MSDEKLSPSERWHREQLARLERELPAADLAYAAALEPPVELGLEEVREWRLAVASARQADREEGTDWRRHACIVYPDSTPYLPGPSVDEVLSWQGESREGRPAGSRGAPEG